MSTRSRLLTWGLPLVGLSALVMGTGLVVKNRPVTTDETPPRQPTTAPTATDAGVAEDGAAYIGAIGTSEPPGEALAIAAHTAGVITDVYVGIGDSVAPGDPLFTIDTSRAEAEVALREAEIDVVTSDLASLRAAIPPLQASVRSAEASAQSARADLRVAEADLADKQNQFAIAQAVNDPRAISREEVDRRRFAAAQAEARVETARAAILRADASVAAARAELQRFVRADGSGDGPEILAAESRVTRARRAVTRAQADMDLLTVRSPVDGRVLQANARQGEFAPASVPAEGLFVLGRKGTMHLRAEIDEVDIPRFSPSARAWASPRGDASRRILLEFVAIEPLVVPKRNLSGRTSELIDTRVLQVVYALDPSFESPGIGQQFDVYVEATGAGS
ncbi:MAG: biotin/lipoyl-binding protein [Phycisphaera sp.]|nr:MAG: biotin/lipoyl-binding protein [Phycisphaera sp.]